MSTPQSTADSLYDRLDYSLQLLYEGVLQNDSEKVETALIALPQVMHEAIDARCYGLLGRVERGMTVVFSQHKLLNKVIAGTVSEEILDQVLEHATPHLTDMAGIGRDKMTVRVGKVIATSMLKRYPRGLKDYQELLNPFSADKHLDTFNMIYTHLLKSTLLLSEDDYRRNHQSGKANLFDITTMNDQEIFSTKLEAIAQVLNENQEVVLKHIDIQRRGTYIKSSPINIRMILKLHEMGFDRLANAWGQNIFHDQILPRQRLLAEQVGISIDQKLVIAKLLFKDSEERFYGKEDEIRMPLDALVYALESDQFSLEDLIPIHAKIAKSREKTNMNLNLRMPSTLASALGAIYHDKMSPPSELLVQKTIFMVDWALKNKPSPYQQELIKTLISLEQLPKSIMLNHPTLRDATFGADLGL